jgi:UDP-N-acetylglucosamine 3-dehydrogenase
MANTMTHAVKIGLIGTGEIGQVHAQAHAATPGTQLCLAALLQPEVEQQLAEKYRAPLYPSLDALLDDATVDAVDICVPNDLHREFAVRALAAGKHVLCEKPIALTLEDADAMIDAARRADRILMIGHVLRFWPEYREAKAALDAGAVGTPLAISARRMVSLLAGTQGEHGWRHDARRSGGAVLDLQIHDLDVFCWLFGSRPTSVFSRGLRSSDGAWSHVFTQLEFPGDRLAFVEASFMMRGNPIDIFLRVLGDQRSIEYTFAPAAFALHDIDTTNPAPPGPSLMLYGWKQPAQSLHVSESDSFARAFRNEVGYFAECVRTGARPAAGSTQQARLALEIALASQRSCETQSPVSLIP